jgi:hypothetical protein
LGSDTDTVATMAGALLGVTASGPPPGIVADQDLIAEEASRLETLGRGESATSFPHPDPLHWQPPSTLADALGFLDGELCVAGLGRVEELSPPLPGQGKDPSLWQWVRTHFGQHLLIKRRARLSELPRTAGPRARAAREAEEQGGETARRGSHDVEPLPADVEDAVALLASAGFDYGLMGRMLVHFARQRSGVTKAGIFAALVAERLRRSSSGSASEPNGVNPQRRAAERRR